MNNERKPNSGDFRKDWFNKMSIEKQIEWSKKISLAPARSQWGVEIVPPFTLNGRFCF